MATNDQAAASVNTMLKAIYSNGTGEAGLEVGADPGLTEAEYVAIPMRCLKRFAVHLKNKEDAKIGADGRIVAAVPWQAGELHPYDPNDDFAQVEGAVDWFIVTPPADVEGMSGRQASQRMHFVYFQGDVITYEGRAVDDVHVEQADYADLCALAEVNLARLPAGELSDDLTRFAVATRIWSVLSGLVTTTKSFEWDIVADPSATSDRAKEIARYAAEHPAQAWTASAARATSWRKTNHCTGGPVAAGFPQRFLAKEGMWASGPDRAANAVAHRASTKAFYLATHAVSVHAALALMLPKDDHHWASICPSAGIIIRWNIHASTMIRMSPRTQVAGSALVVDSVTVIRMLIKEGLAPLLGNLEQAEALRAAFETVESEGMNVAVYARWFFEGAINEPAKVEFSQKDPAFADLVGELAVVATQYYSQSTIAGSASLKNAAAQMADENARNVWTALGAERRRMAPEKILKVARLIKGSASAGAVDNMLATDPDVISRGVSEYNDVTDRLAGSFGMASSKKVDTAEFVTAAVAAAAAT